MQVFITSAADHGFLLSGNLIAEMLSMKGTTFSETLNLQSALNCEKLVKIENFVTLHTDAGFTMLQVLHLIHLHVPHHPLIAVMVRPPTLIHACCCCMLLLAGRNRSRSRSGGR